MKINIGLPDKQRKDNTDELFKLLANTYALYLKTQNFHWNVSGEHFYSLHLLFEKQYEELSDGIDDIAERIRKLGFPVAASFANFSKVTTVKEATTVIPATEMIEQLAADNEMIARSIRDLYEKADSEKDAATADLVTQRLEAHEKAAWMLRSLLQ
jgi:starvation-inducible DNA-binding protein